MAQIFHRSTNTISRVSIWGAVLILVGVFFFLTFIYRSGYVTDINVVREQPVPFSHKHHVSDIGIDCRYCHTTVETSAFAGLPATETCISCHIQIWSDSPMLEPVRASLRENRPIAWTRVHDLPDFVYFNHSIHVNKGIGCETCHGRVDRMPLMWKENTLLMEWCLGCHRQPELYVRPKEYVFTMGYKPIEDQLTIGRKLVKRYKIRSLTDCYTCHR
jgi:hypothetical protein